MTAVVESKNLRHELSLEIVIDAQRASLAFWTAYLWHSCETPGSPSPAFCAHLSERFGVGASEITRQWLDWYGLLTSWELAAALVGVDVRATPGAYGTSHRRA